MIYINGDGFAAASYAACDFSWSRQDSTQFLRGKLIHPKNLTVSFGNIISAILHQPHKIEAWEFNVHSKIFREIYKAIEYNNITYVIITWPSLYKDEVRVENVYYPFSFNGIDKLDYPQNIKDAMYHQMSHFQMPNALSNFENEISNLVNILNSKSIKHLMIPSELKLPVGNANWLWEDETIVSWATKKKLLNHYGFLNKEGHQSLIKIIFDNLTNQ